VQIHDAENAVMRFLQVNPVADCAKIISEMKIAGWLDSREDCFHF